MRKLVLPGELISKEEKRLGNGVLWDQDGVYSSVLGLLDEKANRIRVIPFAGGYDPKETDYVIGIVSDALSTFWRLDIASAYGSILPGGEHFRELRGNERLSDVLPVGSTVFVKIKEVTKTKGVFTTLRWQGTRVLNGGTLIEVSPSKVPRIIGKKDSMIRTIKEETGCDVVAGQNGVIWIKGELKGMDDAIEAIRYIEKHSHESGLTDYIKKMLIEKRKSV